MELTPDFSIVINGLDTFPKERVISIRTSDEAGIISDSCEIELDDFDDALQLPKTEAKLELSLGWKDYGVVRIGTYFVREIFIDGAKKTVRIKANAASKAMRSQKSRANKGGLRDFVDERAGNFGLEPAVSDEIEDIELEDYPQFAESDMSYLTRISQKVGAVAKPVDGHLVLGNDMSAKSVSGQFLQTKYIDAADIVDYSCSFREMTDAGIGAGTVYANWYDAKSGEYHLVHTGSGDPETELNEIFSTEKAALAAVNSKFKKAAKSNQTFAFSTIGRVDLFAESPVELCGFPTKIPSKWVISRVEHAVSNNGFSTQVECCSVG